MWHYCEYIPTLRVQGGQLYHCYHCSAEHFVPDPWVHTPEPQAKPEPLGEIPF